MANFKRNISGLETALRAFFIGVALIGAVNEFSLKNPKIREATESIIIYSFPLYILREEYRGSNQNY